MIQKVIGFIKEVKSELSQVSWSEPRELWTSTKVVLVTAALLSLVVGIFDFLLSRFMNWMVH